MNYSIVIVTYNRLELLKECIACATKQTIPPAHIIVINNASTDDTKAYLDTLQEPLFLVQHLDTNCGGAGGFAAALACSLSTHCDWTMIIDDDAMLTPNHIETLLPYMKRYPDVRAFAGSVLVNGVIDVIHRRNMKMPGFIPVNIPDTTYQEQECFPCDSASFCGLFLKNDVIEQIGLPDASYFIWYDDTEYCIRIRKHTAIFVIPAAILNHKTTLTKQESPRRYTWKDYYGIRNRLWMVQEHGSLPDRIYIRLYVFAHYAFRNYLFHIIHKNHYDWKFEIKTYKKAAHDAKISRHANK